MGDPKRDGSDRVPARGAADDRSAPPPEETGAWQDLGDGRWVPYRIRGSWRGVLG